MCKHQRTLAGAIDMNERIEELRLEIKDAECSLATLRGEEQSILRLAQNNVFETLEDADNMMYSILEGRAVLDCEGSYNCGYDEYTQEFMIGSQKYLASMTFEYNRHAKTYYYIDSSEYSSKEI